MPPDAAAPNQMQPTSSPRSAAAGDLPDGVRRRYFAERRGPHGVDLYVDALVAAPALRDRGARLEAPRTMDPNAIRDMVRIARHRGWEGIRVEGEATFRREAWLAGRSQGLDVRGYRPTDRDLQALARREAKRRPEAAELPRAMQRLERDAGVRSHLDVIEKVVRRSTVEPAAQARILAAARERLAGWLERGATFEDIRLRTSDRAPAKARDPRTR